MDLIREAEKESAFRSLMLNLTLITKSDNLIRNCDHAVCNRLSREALVLERLITSRVRIDLIAHFVLHPEGRYHIRGLEKVLDAQYSAIWRELENLEQAGVIQSEEDGGRRVFRLNPDYPLGDELRGMILKTVGAGDQIRKALVGLDGIHAAFIYGSYADGQVDAYSDLDLMIIGEADLENLNPAVSALEAELGRPVNIITYSLHEWKSKLEAEDPFAKEVLDGPKVMLVGSDHAL